MNIRAYIIVCILFTNSLAKSEDHSEAPQVKRICEYGFNEEQWQSQQATNALYVSQARKTFKTPSKSLIRKMIKYIHAQNRQIEKQQFLQHVTKITPQLQQYSAFYKYLFFILATIFVYWVFKILQKNYSISYYTFSSINSKSINKAVKICLLICAVLSLYLSIIGYREGNKTQKTLSNLVCKIFDQPKGIIKGGNGPQYDSYHAYVVQIQKYLHKFTINFQSIKQLIAKQYVIGQMIKFGKQMVAVTAKTNEIFSSQMNKTVNKLKQVDSKLLDIKQSLHWHNKTLEQSRELVIMLQYQLKVVQNYAKQAFSFRKVIESIGSCIQIFYAFIFLLSLIIIVEVGSLFLRKKISINKSLIQYLLATNVIICLSTAYLNSFIVPGIVWLSPIVDYMSENQNNMREQLNGSKLDLLQILSRFFPNNAKDLTTIYQSHLIKNISQFDSIIRPYYKVKTSYFDELFEKGIQLSKQSQSIDVRRIRFLEKQKLMTDLLVNFQRAKEGVTQMLSTFEPNGELAVINPSAIGAHGRELYRVIRGPFFNRVYNARWLCGSIGTLLLIALICLTFIKDISRSMDNKNESSKLQKIPTHEFESQMIDSAN